MHTISRGNKIIFYCRLQIAHVKPLPNFDIGGLPLADEAI